MVIAEKSKLVRRICQLQVALDNMSADLNEIFQTVLGWVPEDDAHPTDVVAEIFPAQFGPIANPGLHPEGSPAGDSGVYFETRTTADLAPSVPPIPEVTLAPGPHED